MVQLKLSENKYFDKAKERAGKILSNKEKLEEVLSATKNRLGEVHLENSKLSKLGNNLRIFLRMVRAYASGVYKEIPWKSMVAMVAGLVYFLMPLDLVPDFIPFTGFIDDFTVIMLITNAIHQDIELYLEWEETKKH